MKLIDAHFFCLPPLFSLPAL